MASYELGVDRMWERLRDDGGATAAEYAFLLVLIVPFVAAGARVLGLFTVPLFAAPLRWLLGG